MEFEKNPSFVDVRVRPACSLRYHNLVYHRRDYYSFDVVHVAGDHYDVHFDDDRSDFDHFDFDENHVDGRDRDYFHDIGVPVNLFISKEAFK